MDKTIFNSNYVVCPHCEKEFVYNKVNGIALIEAAQNIESRKRMYLRLTLDNLERLSREGKMDFLAVKKTVLDNMNDLVRDIHTILGFGSEAE
jgi:hypothetical protein